LKVEIIDISFNILNIKKQPKFELIHAQEMPSSLVDWFVDRILSRLQREVGSAEGLDLVSKLSLELHRVSQIFVIPKNSN